MTVYLEDPLRLTEVYFVYLRAMAGNFSTQVNYDGKTALAIIVPALKRDGMHYEVNIQGFPRFFMKWSALDRFDLVSRTVKIPDSLVLAVSDAIEKKDKSR